MLPKFYISDSLRRDGYLRVPLRYSLAIAASTCTAYPLGKFIVAG